MKRKRCIKGPRGPANSFSASWPAENATGEVEKVTFQWFSGPCELIFSLMAGPKCYLGEVEKAMFVGVAWLWELFLSPDRPNFDLGEVEKAMFRGVAWPSEQIFCPITDPKCDSGQLEIEMLQGVPWPCELIFLFLAGPTFDFGEA
jgi:hypothetical protein